MVDKVLTAIDSLSSGGSSACWAATVRGYSCGPKFRDPPPPAVLEARTSVFRHRMASQSWAYCLGGWMVKRRIVSKAFRDSVAVFIDMVVEDYMLPENQHGGC